MATWIQRLSSCYWRRSVERIEAYHQKQVILYLRAREWFVRATHGNLYQSGFPDLFATHRKYGHRWVEMKKKGVTVKFQPSQLEVFPLLCANGSGVWILFEATEHEYQKLFRKPNWWQYTEAWK